MAGTPVATNRVAEVFRLHAIGMSNVAIAKEVGIDRSTVAKIIRSGSATPIALDIATLPDPAPEAGGPSLPDAWSKPLKHLQIDTHGTWLVLGDTHLPMHDKATIEAAVADGKARGAVGVLLNGDIMDMFGISPFRRIPTKERFIDEIAIAKQFLAWLRSRFTKVRIVYREGNHEARLRNYIIDRAQALFELPGCHLEEVLELNKLGIEWVQDKAKVKLGKLTTLHGHELRKGEGVNPARLAFLRTTGSVLVGHWHRPSEHHQRSLDDKDFVCWSHGCACFIHPDYDPYNNWGLGWAVVDLFLDGNFSVNNRKFIKGKVV